MEQHVVASSSIHFRFGIIKPHTFAIYNKCFLLRHILYSKIVAWYSSSENQFWTESCQILQKNSWYLTTDADFLQILLMKKYAKFKIIKAGWEVLLFWKTSNHDFIFSVHFPLTWFLYSNLHTTYTLVSVCLSIISDLTLLTNDGRF